MASKTYRYTVNVADSDHAGSFLIQQNLNGAGWATYASETALGQYELIAVFDDTQHNTIQARVKDQDGNVSNVLTKNIVKTGIAGDLLKPADGFTDVWSDTVYNYTKLGWENATDAVQYRAKLDYERSDNGAALSSSYDSNPNNSASGEVNIVMSQPEGVYIRILNNVTLQYTSDGTSWVDLNSHSVTMLDPNAGVINPQLTSPANNATFSDTFEAFGWNDTNNQGYTYFRTVASWAGGSVTGSVTSGVGQNLVGLPDAGEAVTVQLQAGTQDDPGFEAVVVDARNYTAYTAVVPDPIVITYPTDGITIASGTLTMTWTDPPDIQPADRIRLELHDAGNVYQQVHSTITPGTQTLTWSGVPTDGRALILDIGVLKDGTNPIVQAAQVNFTASGAAAPVAAQITSPVANAAFDGTSHTITWSPSTYSDTTKYQVIVFDSGWSNAGVPVSDIPLGTNSAVYTGLPVDTTANDPMHIKLYEQDAGGTELRSHIIDAIAGVSGGGLDIELTAPTSTLTGTSGTAAWTDNTNSSLYVRLIIEDATTNAVLFTGTTQTEGAGSFTQAYSGLPDDGRSLRFIVQEYNSNWEDVVDSITVVNAYTAGGGGGSLTTSSAISQALTSGQTYSIQDKCFTGIHTTRAVHITGTQGTGQTVNIDNSHFSDCEWCVHVENVDTVNITGCMFEDVGNTIRLDGVKNVNVTYNKCINFGVLNGSTISGLSGYWANDFFQAVSCQMLTCDVSHNIIDRSTDSRTNVKANVFAEDYINFTFSDYVGTGKGIVEGNYIRGAVQNCESTSGGGVIFDRSSDLRALNNTLVNTAQYLIGNSSSSDNEFIGNIGYIEFLHDYHVKQQFSKSNSGASGPEQCVGLIVSNYGGSESGAVLHQDNQVIAWRSNAGGTANYYAYNAVNSGTNTYTNNNHIGENEQGGPLADPAGTSILASDMFATYGGGAAYFDESQTCS